MEIPKAADKCSDSCGRECGAVEGCVAVPLAEELAAVPGRTYLESRGFFPGRAAVKTLCMEISIRRKTAT